MLRTSVIVAVAFPLLTGCGELSNQLFAEDALYLAALPDEARHTVGIEEDAAKAEIGELPELLEMSEGTARDLNTIAKVVLQAVNTVRALPPSQRTENGRRWGPIPYEGAELSVAAAREGPGLFTWAFEAEGFGTSGTFLEGTHYAGETVLRGDGSFRWDIGLSLAATGRSGSGVLTVDYDSREGVDLLMDFDDVDFGGGEPVLDGQYAWRNVDGVADFQYRAIGDLDFDDSDLPGTTEVRMRKEVQVGGRADARIYGGGLGDTVVELHQCWDAAEGLVWQADNVGYFPERGDESLCAYADAATVDRLGE